MSSRTGQNGVGDFMILTDYFRAEPDETWALAKLCGVRHGTVRLPETADFDPADGAHVRAVMDRFRAAGITPLVVEPLPNALHDAIKLGTAGRDRAIETLIALLKNLHEAGVTTLCFNFMAHYGWTRTATDLPDRGGAQVTGFRAADFAGDGFALPAAQVWANYEYFVKAVVPYAERYRIRLALHPDDPPVPQLGQVGRIFTNADAIVRGIETVRSDYLGVTFCQACYYLMGAPLTETIAQLADKIFFIHFRNVRGTKTDFRETFHDDGAIDMAAAMQAYARAGLDVPIRVDHVPSMPGEHGLAGYDALGRLFAIGYLKGILAQRGGKAQRQPTT